MRRRTLLAVLGSGLATLAGCSTADDAGPSGTGTGPATVARGDTSTRRRDGTTRRVFTRPTVTARPVPARPDALDESAVGEYVRRYERSVLQGRFAENGATATTESCTATVDRETPVGTYAYAGCAGHARVGPHTRQDGGSFGAYLVTPTETRRIGQQSDVRVVTRRRTTTASTGGDGQPLGSPAGLRVYNFSDASRHVTVRVASAGPTSGVSPPVVFERTYRLDGRSGVLLTDVVARADEYRVTARVGDGPPASHRWVVTPDYRRASTVVTVGPAGGLAVRDTFLADVANR